VSGEQPTASSPESIPEHAFKQDGDLAEETVMKDPRRDFTAMQKEEMLIREGFACADCRRPFDRRRPGREPDRWTGYPPVYHHVIFHEHGGPTTLDNGVALCRHCHHWGYHGRVQWWCRECQLGEWELE